MVFERKILFPQRWSKYLPCEDEARAAHADGRKKQLVELSMESKVILNMQHISPTMICPISKIYNLLSPRYLKTCNHWLEKAQKEYNQKLGVEVNVTIFISASLPGHQLQMKCADPLSLGPYLLWKGAQLISHQKNSHGFWLQKFYHHQTRALMHCKGCLKHQKY